MGTKSDISENTDNKRSTDKNINKYLVKVEEPGTLLNMRPGVWLIIGTEKEKTNDDLHKVNKTEKEKTNDDLHKVNKSDKLYNKDPKVWLFKWTKDQKDQETEQEKFSRFSAQYELSAREREVLMLILQEKNNQEIAEILSRELENFIN